MADAADAKSEFKCKICQIPFKEIHAYTEHLESKQHIKGIMKQKYGQKYLEAKEMLENKHSNNVIESDKNDNVVEKINIPENEKEEDTNSDEDEVYTCFECKKVCTGLLNYKLHLSGNKHLKKLKSIKTLKELESKRMIPDDYKTPDYDLLSQLMSKSAPSGFMCEKCSIRCTGPESYRDHCNGEGHKKQEAKLRVKKEMEGLPANTSKEDLDDTHSCDVCSKVFSGILPYKQHMDSVTHLKQIMKNHGLNKIKDLCNTSYTNSKLECKECKKVFSGPAPFEAHLKSSSHLKLKKKNTIYAELEKNYPEMVKAPIGESDSDSDDEKITPACGVCNMIFSGPEAALDHFSSEKHKKALRKKKRIDKNKRILKRGIVSQDKKTVNKEENAEEECSSDGSFENLTT